MRHIGRPRSGLSPTAACRRGGLRYRDVPRDCPGCLPPSLHRRPTEGRDLVPGARSHVRSAGAPGAGTETRSVDAAGCGAFGTAPVHGARERAAALQSVASDGPSTIRVSKFAGETTSRTSKSSEHAISRCRIRGGCRTQSPSLIRCTPCPSYSNSAQPFSTSTIWKSQSWTCHCWTSSCICFPLALMMCAT